MDHRTHFQVPQEYEHFLAIVGEMTERFFKPLKSQQRLSPGLETRAHVWCFRSEFSSHMLSLADVCCDETLTFSQGPQKIRA